MLRRLLCQPSPGLCGVKTPGMRERLKVWAWRTTYAPVIRLETNLLHHLLTGLWGLHEGIYSSKPLSGILEHPQRAALDATSWMERPDPRAGRNPTASSVKSTTLHLMLSIFLNEKKKKTQNQLDLILNGKVYGNEIGVFLVSKDHFIITWLYNTLISKRQFSLLCFEENLYLFHSSSIDYSKNST